MQHRMTGCGAHIRSLEKIEQAIRDCRREIASIATDTKISSTSDIPRAFMNRDILITQYVYLCAIRDYIRQGGGSRGSYLVQDKNGRLPMASLPDDFRFSLDNKDCLARVCEIALDAASMTCQAHWTPVRPIPSDDNWFENVWAAYRKGNIIT